MTEENWKEILNTQEIIKFKAVYAPKTYKIKYKHDKVSEIINLTSEGSYTPSDEKGKSLNDSANLSLSTKPYSGFDLKAQLFIHPKNSFRISLKFKTSASFPIKLALVCF